MAFAINIAETTKCAIIVVGTYRWWWWALTMMMMMVGVDVGLDRSEKAPECDATCLVIVCRAPFSNHRFQASKL